MTKIKKLGHVVLYVRDAMASADWYIDILGMEVVVSNSEIPAVFLSFGERDHDLALFGIGDRRPVGGHDVNHVSFEIDGDLDDLKAFHAKLQDRGAKITGVVDHGISYGVYFFDPDGHQLEVFYQRIQPDSDAKKALAELGAVATPVTLDNLPDE
jgi:catechol 2,3-dioxygenase